MDGGDSMPTTTNGNENFGSQSGYNTREPPLKQSKQEIESESEQGKNAEIIKARQVAAAKNLYAKAISIGLNSTSNEPSNELKALFAEQYSDPKNEGFPALVLALQMLSQASTDATTEFRTAMDRLPILLDMQNGHFSERHPHPHVRPHTLAT